MTFTLPEFSATHALLFIPFSSKLSSGPPVKKFKQTVLSFRRPANNTPPDTQSDFQHYSSVRSEDLASGEAILRP